jgi:hypothetical protein
MFLYYSVAIGMQQQRVSNQGLSQIVPTTCQATVTVADRVICEYLWLWQLTDTTTVSIRDYSKRQASQPSVTVICVLDGYLLKES